MICYCIRHGKDDDTVRGGWASHGLTTEGTYQIEQLAKTIGTSSLNIKKIYSSDLKRAADSGLILSRFLNIPINLNSDFREVNNGALAGMCNKKALVEYPNSFWNTLEWTEKYPGNGESPRDFYLRIKTAWQNLTKELSAENENIALVTHGGVISVIYSIINNIEYTNKTKILSVPPASIFPVEITKCNDSINCRLLPALYSD